MSEAAAALQDMGATVTRARLWGMLAWEDIRLRYRGSLFGPFWMTLGTGITSAGLAFVFGGLFGQPWGPTVAYISAGLAIWTFISASLLEACMALISAASVIRNVPMPLSVHVWRVVMRNFIVFLHSLPVVALFLAIARPPIGWESILFIPAMFMIVMWCFLAGFILAILCARFRDIPQLMTYVLPFIFFITPVFWRANQIKGSRSLIVRANPLAQLLSTARDPIVGIQASLYSWLVSLTLLAVTAALAFIVLRVSRRRVALWV